MGLDIADGAPRDNLDIGNTCYSSASGVDARFSTDHSSSSIQDINTNHLHPQSSSSSESLTQHSRDVFYNTGMQHGHIPSTHHHEDQNTYPNNHNCFATNHLVRDTELPIPNQSMLVQSFVREGPNHSSPYPSNTQLSHPQQNAYNINSQATAGYDVGAGGGLSNFNSTDYFPTWNMLDDTSLDQPGYCCGFENTFCCDEVHATDLPVCFEEDCQVAPCPDDHEGCIPCTDSHNDCIPATCFDQACQETPCQDSHGGLLMSAGPCFDTSHQYLPTCNYDGCAIPGMGDLVIDTQTVSAAAQLAALTRASMTPRPPTSRSTQTSQPNDYASILNDFTHHNTFSSTYTGHDSGISGLSRSNTTSLTDTEDESVSSSSPTNPTNPSTHTLPNPRKRVLPTRHICLWTDPTTSTPCNATFPTSALLHSHVDTAHIDRLDKDSTSRFRCHWSHCKRTTEQTFTAKPKLKRHVQTHTHHKPYQCQHCNTNMKTKDALEKHTRIHTGEAPYKCSECNKTFKTSTEHKTHMTAVHSNLKPHECPHCGQRFADSSNLSKHKKTHWMGSFKCLHPGCKAHMKRWDQIRRHFQTQAHCPELLVDGSEEQRRYKREMQESWLAIPEQQRLLMGRAGLEVQQQGSAAFGRAGISGVSRETTEEVETTGKAWTMQQQEELPQRLDRGKSVLTHDMSEPPLPLSQLSIASSGAIKRPPYPLDDNQSARNKKVRTQ